MRFNKNSTYLSLITFFISTILLGQHQQWAHKQNELTKDPNINYGQLANGLRYALSPKGEKKNHCFLRLVVHVGSIYENENERGIAHFLEHLAFDGSKNFAKGTLIGWFQKMGMQFGPHLNAHTSLDETVYKIDLPNCSPNRLRKALRVLRDFADGLLLDESEIEKEQAIIDMEEQDRNSKQLRISEKILKEFYPGTTYAQRLPIGKKNIRKIFTRETIEAFYKKWYRPDNMTLIMVGDFDAKNLESDVHHAFDSMPKADDDNLLPPPDRGSLNTEHRTIQISEKDYTHVAVSFLSTVQQKKYDHTTNYTKEDFFERKKVALIKALYSYVISQHLLSHNDYFYTVNLVDEFDFDIKKVGVSFYLHKDQWEKGLAQASHLHQEILTCGFSEKNFQAVLAIINNDLQETLENQQPEHVLHDLMNEASGGFPRLNPKDYVSLYRQFLTSITLNDLNDFLKEHFCHTKTLSANILMIGDFTKNENTSFVDQAHTIVTKGLNTAVSCKKEKDIEFAYKSTMQENPAQFTVVKNEAFNYHSVKFENGVTAHLKANIDPRMPKKVLVSAKIGHGTLEFDHKDNALSSLGDSSLILGGTKKHPLHHIQTLLAGKNVSFSFSLNRTNCSLSGQSSAKDLLHYLEWNRAYISDAAFSAQSITKQKYNLIQDLTNQKNTYFGPLSNDYVKALYNDDERFSPLTKEQINSPSDQKVKTWMKNNLLNRCPEFTIVGDIKIQKTIQYLSQTFGDLKCSIMPTKEDILAKSPVLLPDVHKKYTIESKDPQALIGFYWPVQSKLKKNEVLVSTIQSIIDDRTRNLLREKLGVAYSPQVSIELTQYPWQHDFLYVGVTTDPLHVKKALEFTPSIVESFLTHPVTQQELERAKNPVLEQLSLMKTSTAFWFNIIPIKEQNFQSIEEALQPLVTCTHDQINATIIDMFSFEKYSTVVVSPTAKSSKE